MVNDFWAYARYRKQGQSFEGDKKQGLFQPQLDNALTANFIEKLGKLPRRRAERGTGREIAVTIVAD